MGINGENKFFLQNCEMLTENFNFPSLLSRDAKTFSALTVGAQKQDILRCQHSHFSLFSNVKIVRNEENN